MFTKTVTARLAVNSRCPDAGKCGAFLYTGENKFAVNCRVSPVHENLPDALEWAARAGWIEGDGGSFYQYLPEAPEITVEGSDRSLCFDLAGLQEQSLLETHVPWGGAQGVPSDLSGNPSMVYRHMGVTLHLTEREIRRLALGLLRPDEITKIKRKGDILPEVGPEFYSLLKGSACGRFRKPMRFRILPV